MRSCSPSESKAHEIPKSNTQHRWRFRLQLNKPQQPQAKRASGSRDCLSQYHERTRYYQSLPTLPALSRTDSVLSRASLQRASPSSRLRHHHHPQACQANATEHRLGRAAQQTSRLRASLMRGTHRPQPRLRPVEPRNAELIVGGPYGVSKHTLRDHQCSGSARYRRMHCSVLITTFSRPSRSQHAPSRRL